MKVVVIHRYYDDTFEVRTFSKQADAENCIINEAINNETFENGFEPPNLEYAETIKAIIGGKQKAEVFKIAKQSLNDFEVDVEILDHAKNDTEKITYADIVERAKKEHEKFTKNTIKEEAQEVIADYPKEAILAAAKILNGEDI